MTISEALKAATARLADLSDTPRLDAELLMANAAGVGRDVLILRMMERPEPGSFRALLARRITHEPVAYIIGERDFWSINLLVAPGVLIPRPDSETLIEAALEHFTFGGVSSILDLGTGSGALLLAAMSEWPKARGLGIDASLDAVTIARTNAVRLDLRAEFRLGNWAEGLTESFDLILCNPPYVESGAELAPQVRDFEPASALFAGSDGLDDYRRLAPQIGRLIAPAGCAVIEIGSTQAEAASALFAAENLNIAVKQDLGGRDRCLVLTHQG